MLIGLFAAPKFWVRTLPDLASLYEMAGMTVNVGGVDFDMIDVKFLQKVVHRSFRLKLSW